MTNGYPQGPNGLIVPSGSISFQLNTDATVIANPGGFVSAAVIATFQFNAAGQIQPPAGSAYAQIYSNLELNPQNSEGLGTYYLVTFYDANGARINAAPMWWQFVQPATTVVDISQVVPVSTVGGNVIYYPTSFLSGVTSVTFTGDGTVLSSTPSAPVTSVGTLTATLNTQTAATFLAGPVSGPVAAPTFRAIALTDLPSGYNSWSSLTSATSSLVLANTTYGTTFEQTAAATWLWENTTAATSTAAQSSPIFAFEGQYWTGSLSSPDTWSLQNFLYRGYVYTLTAVVSAGGGRAFYTVSPNLEPLPPVGATVLVAGFTNSANNGSFTVAGGTTSTLTLNNGSAIMESHAATGTVTNLSVSAGALVLTHVGATRSQFLIPSTEAGTYPDIGFVQDTLSGLGYVGSGQVQLLAGGVIYGFSTATLNIAGVGNITFANSAAGVISVAADPTSSYALSAASNASAGNTTYTGTFSPTIPAGTVVNIGGFTNSGNNALFAVVVSCSSTMLVVVNANGVLEVHAGTVTTPTPSIFIGTGGLNLNGFTATLGLPHIAYDPPTNNSWTASQAGRMWFNTATAQLKDFDGTNINVIPQSPAKINLVTQSAAISATTIFAVPSTAPGLYRVTWSATITTADGVSSSLGGTTGFQLKYTNGSDSVVKTTNPTTSVVSAGNTTGTSIGGVVVAECKGGTNLQYLFGYTSNTPGQMIFDLNASVEYLG